jgi:hypothetical protein
MACFTCYKISPNEQLSKPAVYGAIRKFFVLSSPTVTNQRVPTVGLNQLWEDGVVYTVVVFATVISVQRPAWRRTSFWTSLALILGAHTLILFSLLQMLTPNRFGMPKLLLIPLAVVEGIFPRGPENLS